ncbi:hypothetical protein GOV05_04980 [Candidatus Woesearchaeota archaeon]|nr:hypothetical protein [Candidatus Woesearchaeota archaeon]
MVLKKLSEEFEKTRKELGFKSSLDELNQVFFIKDYIEKEGFVSQDFSRQLCSRIVDTYNQWYGYLHTLVVPNPHSMFNMTESQFFGDEEKEKIMLLMDELMNHSSKNTIIGLEKNKKEEAIFIDDSLSLWDKKIKPELLKLLKKIAKGWENKKNS